MKSHGIFIGLGISLVLLSCGKSSESSDNATTPPTGTLALNVVGVSQESSGSSLALSSDAGFYRPSAIASGAPSYFSVEVTQIRLMGTDSSTGSEVALTILDEPEGKPLLLNNGKVDISNLFSSYTCVLDGGVPVDVGGDCPCGIYKDDQSIVKKVISEETGEEVCPYEGENGRVIINPIFTMDSAPATYTKLSVNLKRDSKMSGCVSATFSELSAHPGEHEYCTQAKHALGGSTTPAASEFEVGSDKAEIATVPLSKSYPGSETVYFTFPIPGGMELKVGETSPLSLVVDTNRILRFYNMGRTDEGPNPDFPTNYAYFFTTVFDESFYGFAGSPGEIRGYQWIAQMCDDSTDCTSVTNPNDLRIIQGWMTVIYDSAGQPIIASFMPDDDNALTVIKGSNVSNTGPDPKAFVKSGDVYDLTMTLSEKKATINGVNLDLKVGDSQETTFVGLGGVKANVSIVRKL